MVFNVSQLLFATIFVMILCFPLSRITATAATAFVPTTIATTTRARQCLPKIIRSSERSRSFLLVRHAASVTGPVYQDDEDDKNKNGNGNLEVKLFTKQGCTLCVKVKDVLQELRSEVPHSLHQIDITDDCHSEWYAKYKYDIPVLHLNDRYWLKHRTTAEEARAGFLEARNGTFAVRTGEPNAEAMERKKS